MKRTLPVILIFVLTMVSCSRGIIFEQYEKIERNIWNRFDVIEFEVPVEDVSANYDFYVAIRYMEQFPLNYITLDFTFYAPSGEERSTQIRIDMKDKDGNMAGKGMGDLWDIEKLVREDYRFSEPGTCKFEISSTMSYADLPGIMQVGLIVRKGG